MKMDGDAAARMHGRRQAVRCVELQRTFSSLSAAARFINRAPSNISQAIRVKVRCGGYHWEKAHAERSPVRERLPDANGGERNFLDAIVTKMVPTWRRTTQALAEDSAGRTAAN
jgi:hypothetical protein